MTMDRSLKALVIGCAILWLPVSFGISTLMHVLLIAHAMTLPAWMQFLHPLDLSLK